MIPIHILMGWKRNEGVGATTRAAPTTMHVCFGAGGLGEEADDDVRAYADGEAQRSPQHAPL